MTTEIDPALRENLAELADLAREIGAERVIIIRNTTDARLTWQLADIDQARPGVTLNLQTALPLPDAGTLVVLLFPASDGKQSPLEAL